MPRFSANLSMLFTEVAFLDRFAAAASSGFKAVEFMFPYDFNKEAIAKALATNRLTLALHNLPSGDWAAGERGIACHPSRVAEFRDGVGRRRRVQSALDYVREGDILVVWKLDRLGRSLPHLIQTVTSLADRGVGFRSITEAIDTTTSGGRLVFHLFGALGQL